MIVARARGAQDIDYMKYSWSGHPDFEMRKPKEEQPYLAALLLPPWVRLATRAIADPYISFIAVVTTLIFAIIAATGHLGCFLLVPLLSFICLPLLPPWVVLGIRAMVAFISSALLLPPWVFLARTIDPSLPHNQYEFSHRCHHSSVGGGCCRA